MPLNQGGAGCHCLANHHHHLIGAVSGVVLRVSVICVFG